MDGSYRIFILLLGVGILSPSNVYSFWPNMQETNDFISSMWETIKPFAQNIPLVLNFLDSSVEEDCVYKCSKGYKIFQNINHIPKANGCGSLGMYVERDKLFHPQMEDCCNNHDICYDSCGNDKEMCDLVFKRCLYSFCDYKYDILSEKTCKASAKMLYTATLAFGCKSFKDSQKDACVCIPVSNSNNEL